MEQRPCTSTAMHCVALCLDGKSVCAAHFKNHTLHPKEYKRDHAKKHWPPTPWDDEIPWHKDKR